jgi:hypothetical protein
MYMKEIGEGWRALPQTRDDFSAFLRELARSRRENPALWENDTIESFLDAAAAWVDDMDGWFSNGDLPVPQDASWQLMAAILEAGRVYE